MFTHSEKGFLKNIKVELPLKQSVPVTYGSANVCPWEESTSGFSITNYKVLKDCIRFPLRHLYSEPNKFLAPFFICQVL